MWPVSFLLVIKAIQKETAETVIDDDSYCLGNEWAWSMLQQMLRNGQIIHYLFRAVLG
jgi:hypothetical protein